MTDIKKEKTIINTNPDIEEFIKQKQRKDGWSSALTGLGGARDKTTDLSIYLSIPLSEYGLEALYMDDDLAANIVDSVPDDALSKGVIVKGTDSDKIMKAFEKMEGLSKIVDAWKMGRLFGGAALFLGIQDADQKLPLITGKHGRLLFTMVFDRFEMQPATYYQDPTSQKYGQPKTYFITPKDSGVVGGSSQFSYGKEVHETRLIMFDGPSTPKRWKLRNNGWNASVLQRVYNVLRDYNGIWKSSSYAVADLSQGVFKVSGLTDMISQGQSQVLMDRMAIVDMARSVARSVIVDAENEDFTVVGAANLTAIPTILDQANSRVASAARMPVTRLMGISPGGLNATGESDLSWWYGYIDIAREQVAKPNLLKLFKVIAHSYGLKTDDIGVEFEALWSLSELEEAELRNKQSTTDKTYIEMGVISKEEVRDNRFGSTFGYSSETEIE